MMDALELLKRAWPFEVMWILINFTTCLWAGDAIRQSFFLQALPLLTTLIGGQGLIAAAGPEIKRWLEMKGNGK